MGFGEEVFESLERFGFGLALKFETFAAGPFVHLAGYQAGELEKLRGRRVTLVVSVHEDAVEAKI
jgi:hypothetical protein